MKSTFKFTLILCLFAFISFTSCQDEVVEVSSDQEETIAPNSNVAQLMRSTSSNDGSVDNVLDGTDCFSINLPVTIIANGITITIDSLEDLELLEEIFDEIDDDEDVLEFLFPITIILNDYTEIVIEDEDELEDFIEQCSDDDTDVIECVDFVYPISFSIYNADFQLIDTVVIENDQQLYLFLEDLVDSPNGAVIASLNYPVTLVYSDGTTIEVTSNQELEAAINAAEDECDDDEDDDCELEDVLEDLQDCFWNIVNYNDSNDLLAYDLYFETNGVLVVYLNGNIIFDGDWTVSETDEGLLLTIETDWQDINGSWLFVECDDDRFKLLSQDASNDGFMIIEQNCEDDPFDCFDDAFIVICDNDGVNDGITAIDLEELFEECSEDNIEYSVHESLVDAETNVNALISPYTNTTNPQTLYVRIALAGNPDVFEVFEVDVIIEDCSQGNCTEEEVDDYLMECHWVPVSINGSDDFSSYDFYFNEEQELVVQGNGVSLSANWMTSGNPNGGTIVTISGLEANFQMFNSEWLVIECSENFMHLQNGDQILLMERTCDDATPNDVVEIMTDDIWIVANYEVGNTNLTSDYDGSTYNFTSSTAFEITTPDDAILDGVWMVENNGDMLQMTLDVVPIIEPYINLTGTYKIFELDDDRIELHDLDSNGNIERILVFEKE